MSSRRRHVQGNKRDPGAQRSSRLNELLREIISEELTRIDDDRLRWVSVTHVKTDRSLDRAVVSFTAALGDSEDEAELVEVFERYRKRLQAAIGRQTTLRRTPPLSFEPDTQLREATRIEELLAADKARPGNPQSDSHEHSEEETGADGSAGDDGSGPEVPGNPSGSSEFPPAAETSSEDE